MIVQASPPVKFIDGARIEVLLRAPTRAQTILALAVVANRSVALQVSDGGGGGRWKCAATPGGTSLWHRLPDRQGGVIAISIATANAQEISGTAIAIETAGVAPGVALQLLSDLLVGT